MANLRKRLAKMKLKKDEFPSVVEEMVFIQTAPGLRTTPADIERLLRDRKILRDREKKRQQFAHTTAQVVDLLSLPETARLPTSKVIPNIQLIEAGRAPRALRCVSFPPIIPGD